MRQRLHSWRQDHLLRGVLKSSSYLFSSNALSAALSFLQGIFAVRLLGADGYGLVSGTVIVFASNVNRLLRSLLLHLFAETLKIRPAGGMQNGQVQHPVAE